MTSRLRSAIASQFQRENLDQSGDVLIRIETYIVDFFSKTAWIFASFSRSSNNELFLVQNLPLLFAVVKDGIFVYSPPG